jgi:hypothetical protein
MPVLQYKDYSTGTVASIANTECSFDETVKVKLPPSNKRLCQESLTDVWYGST